MYNWLVYKKENKEIIAKCNTKEYAKEIKQKLQSLTDEKLDIIYKEINDLTIKI